MLDSGATNDGVMTVHADGERSAPRPRKKASGASFGPPSRTLGNFARFDTDVVLAEAALAQGDLETAAFYAATAATVATHKHCGVFGSPRLERLLNEIGRRIPDDGAADFTRSPSIRKVLHVGTELAPVGGLTRMISRWIRADEARTSSLVLTRHRGEAPEHLSQAVTESGGRIHRLNHRMGAQADWVRALRRLARQHDLIVLHIHCEDVIPLLAFADAAKFPPVVFLNHADHIFWLGPSVGHVVANLRDAATDISMHRRGVASERNFLLPTIVDRTVRSRSRAEAKALLGIDPDTTLLVSVARKEKYRSIDGSSFADMHADILERHPEAKLLVVGPGEPADWTKAIARTGGRIIGVAETPETQPYFEAADIYVDSYPFVSSTSMMEAGGYGAPLLSLFTAPEEARIFGINHVGLVGSALVASTRAEYDRILERLIVDPAFRERTGEAGRLAIERAHVPPSWTTHLEALYARARELPPLDYRTRPGDVVETPELGPLDLLHETIFGYDYSVAEIKKVYMSALPMRQRLAKWSQMRADGEIRGASESLRMLMPEWLKRRLAT